MWKSGPNGIKDLTGNGQYSEVEGQEIVDSWSRV